jgi:tRNA A-37 threonylcarbamoyl transferase component Bud32
VSAAGVDLFCMADPVFFDTGRPHPDGAGDAGDFPIADRPAPPGWRRSDTTEWVLHRPEASVLPDQGWKIHVSACTDNATRVLDAVWDHCVSRGLAFKFLRGPLTHLLRNAKQAARGYSGKLATIYPSDVAGMELACKELDDRIGGEPGPYVLSDLRWNQGPVYVRYGGFSERRCRSASGELVLAIEDDTGTLVPDRRTAGFAVPPWLSLPDCLAPHLAARNSVTVADMPYEIESALLFSNGGGVYAGRDARSGEPVVLKEARPHAGLTADGVDAVARLRTEHRVLQRLAGIDGVPAVRDLVSAGDHLFLVMDRVEGTPLNREMVRRHPGLGRTVDPAAAAAHARWAVGVCDRVERILDAIHDRGVVYADLHPRNVLVGPDDRVTLVDYEVAHDAASPRPQELAAPGFQAARDRVGAAIDDYALACLRLALFTPLTALFRLSPRKAGQLAELVAATFPVPPGWLDAAVRTVAADGPLPGPPPAWDAAEPGGWPETRAALVRAIVASADTGRHDRLFPGDAAQFRTGGVNLAHGAAGVLYALSVTGAGRFPDYERWLVDHAADQVEEPRLGFYEGLHGVIHVLDHLDHRERALDLLTLALAERWETTGHDLRDGLAGIGLNLTHLAREVGEPAFRAAALRAADVLAERLGALDDTGDVSGGTHPHAGLMRGWAGPALLFVHLYEATGDAGLLDHAARALRHDLRRCTVREDDDGAMHVNEGWRTMPYLDSGSVGIGLVLDRYLAHRHDERFAAASAAIHGAACSWFYVEPGLFSGRAGMVAYLATRRQARPAAEWELRHQIDRLSWHALAYGGGIAFPGQQLLRLSMDLATGTAGVLLALGAALHDEPVHLPFLGPAGPAGSALPARPRQEERR